MSHEKESKMKKHQKKENKREPVIVEPVRKNLRQIVEKCFADNDRVLCLHEVIVIGEYNLPDPVQLATIITEIVAYYCSHVLCLESATGCLIYYDHYFTIMLEGGEEILYDITKTFCAHLGNRLKESKFLCVIHHVNNRLFDNFMTYYGKPNILIGNLPQEPTIDETMKYVEYCIKKVYDFATNYRIMITEEAKGPRHFGSVSSFSSSLGASSTDSNSVKKKKAFGQKQALQEYLLENEVIQFILNRDLPTIQQYVSHYGQMRPIYSFDRVTWPIQADMLFYNVLKNRLEYDCPTSLPKVQ